MRINIRIYIYIYNIIICVYIYNYKKYINISPPQRSSSKRFPTPPSCSFGWRGSMGSQWHLFRLRGRAFLCSDSLGCYLLGVWSSRGPWQCECVFPIRLEIPISGYVTNQEYFFFQNRNKAVAIIKCLPCISHRISAWDPAPWPIREKNVRSTFLLSRFQKLANL